MSSNITLEQLQHNLRTKIFGKPIFLSSKVNSTNDWAKQLAETGAAEGTVALAQIQTAAYGRQGRSWASPAGGLWFSIILRPRNRANEAAKLTFIASLAVAEVLREQYDLKAEIKWPNDVLVNSRKICGVLAEMNTTNEKVNNVVLGVGINVNFKRNVLPKSLRTKATSVESELGRKIILQDLFNALMKKMEDTYQEFLNEDPAHLLKQWKTFAGFLGKTIIVIESHETLRGTALDVDEDGALILALEDGTKKRMYVGDVTSMKRACTSEVQSGE